MSQTTRCLVVLILLVLPAAIGSTGDVEIHHFDVGNGDFALVLGTNGRGLIIDCGTVWWCKSGDPDRVIDQIEALLNGNDYSCWPALDCIRPSRFVRISQLR